MTLPQNNEPRWRREPRTPMAAVEGWDELVAMCSRYVL